MRPTLVCFFFAFVACGAPEVNGRSDSGRAIDGGMQGEPDAGQMSTDSGAAITDGGDRTSDAGTVTTDAGTVATDAGSQSACGDTIVTGAELCDSDTVACSTLAISYKSGMASCRSNCQGYDVSTCALDDTVAAEQVRPAVRDPRWANAMCNDGTSYAFSISVSPTGSKEWVFFLEGGGFCDGKTRSCLPPEQPVQLTSSKNAPADRAKLTGTGGSTLLNRSGAANKNPRFHDANFVFGTYCTSDLWSGTRSEPYTLEGQTWRNTGKLNVKAMLEVARQRFGLDDADPSTKILYTGGSAGGNGARNTVDLVVTQMPNTAAAQRIALAPENGFMPLGWTWTDEGYSIASSGLTDLAFYEETSAVWHSQISGACATYALTQGQLPSACAAGLLADVALMKPVAEGGLNLRIFEYQSRRDTVYAGDLHRLKTPTLRAPWDALIAKEISDAGLRWFFTPDSSIHGLQGSTAGGGLFNYHHVPFPAYSAASSPTCASTPYASGKDYYSMVVDFFDDPTPATSGERVCFNTVGTGLSWP